MTTLSADVQAEGSDLLQAVDFAHDCCQRWQQLGTISPEQYQALRLYYRQLKERLAADPAAGAELPLRPREVCWSCRAPVARTAKACAGCGAPVQGVEVRTLRYLSFLGHEIKKHEKEGRLNLAAAHDCMEQVNGRIAALRRKLDAQRIPLAEAVPLPVARRVAPRLTADPEAEPAPRRSLLEILLDPKSIQWLLASGGALLVLGLVIWLVARGVFENKLFVAVLLGAGNAALLAGGWAMIRFTRYNVAGRALTLLACLLMPLNLWFYDSQGLITLKEGGHLWVPALVCCVLYAASARLLRDRTFVYVFVGGIALTGLLLLADRYVEKFWEISAPATLLVVLGLLSLHAERAFPESEGPFSRKQFGLAFFWSGHGLLGAGLLLVLGAQLCGGLLYGVFEPAYQHFGFGQPGIVATAGGRLLALALVLAGTYAYVYSDLVVRRRGVYLYVAVFTLLWAELLAINLFQWPIPAGEVMIIALALTGLAANLAMTALARSGSSLLRLGPPLALFLCVLPVALGVGLHFRATAALIPEWQYPIHGSYVVAMLLTAISCRVGAYLYRHDRPSLSLTYFFGTAAATLAGAAALLLLLSPGMPWHRQAPLLMLIPLAYLVASRLYRGHTPERPLAWVAHAATVVMLVASLGAAFQGFVLVEGQGLNLALAAFFAEAALFYGLAAGWRKDQAAVYAATAMACAAVWQVLKYGRVADEYYTLAFSLVGLLLLVGYRFAVLEKFNLTGLARAAFQCGNALLSLAFVAGALMTLSELLTRQATRGVLIPLLLLLTAASLAAVALVRQRDWRRWYVATAVANAALVVLVLAVLGNLTPGQKLEVVSVVIGLILLVAGHLGWYREQEGQNELVTLGLTFGSLLVAVPLTVAVLYCRTTGPDFGTFHTLNELGMLAAGLVLLAAGFMSQVRSTTLSGAFLMAAYLVSLVLFIRFPRQLQTTAVYMMVGGGLFFGAGLLLSLYRDRLLALPEKIKRREGVFRVLTWR